MSLEMGRLGRATVTVAALNLLGTAKPGLLGEWKQELQL